MRWRPESDQVWIEYGRRPNVEALGDEGGAA